VFERFAPKLAAANIDHRINVLRCSQAARTVGDVIASNASRIKASMIVMSMRDKSRLAEALLGSCCNHVMHRSPVPVVVVRGSAAAAAVTAAAAAAAAPAAPEEAAAAAEN
jgi:nucleotide-binding universal stress UspA family protein